MTRLSILRPALHFQAALLLYPAFADTDKSFFILLLPDLPVYADVFAVISHKLDAVSSLFERYRLGDVPFGAVLGKLCYHGHIIVGIYINNLGTACRYTYFQIYVHVSVTAESFVPDSFTSVKFRCGVCKPASRIIGYGYAFGISVALLSDKLIGAVFLLCICISAACKQHTEAQSEYHKYLFHNNLPFQHIKQPPDAL